MTLAHQRVEQQDMRSHPNLSAMPVVLFGYGGEWSQKNWVPVLETLARWNMIHLTVVDRWQAPPPELCTLEREGVLSYVPWEVCFESQGAQFWRAAFVITSAGAHAHVIHGLLEKASSLQVIVCEKPWGVGLQQARAMFQECRRAHVILLVSDHYLLRPPVQYLLTQHSHLLRGLGEIVHITAVMNEVKQTGPSQGVIADMSVHLLDLLLILFPSAQFVPDSTLTAHALNHPHTSEETYCFSSGHLLIPSQAPVPCQVECGKQLWEQKDLTIVGINGRVHLDLLNNSLTVSTNSPSSKEVHRWNPSWSYARLILRTLSLCVSQPGLSQRG